VDRAEPFAAMAYVSYENLEVWKRACQLAVDVYRALEGCRDYGFKDQMTSAAVSIASNIAEGAERDSTPDYLRFLHIAKGSAAELRTQIFIVGRIGLLVSDHQEGFIKELNEISSMLHGLIKSLKLKT